MPTARSSTAICSQYVGIVVRSEINEAATPSGSAVNASFNAGRQGSSFHVGKAAVISRASFGASYSSSTDHHEAAKANPAAAALLVVAVARATATTPRT